MYEPEGRSHNLMLIGKNKRKMGKKALCLIFAFLLSINSFAAIVSDNDGAAFVTKAEFEALKNNFASQVEQYNTSIDNRIDGAIASYLAGIRIKKHTKISTIYAPAEGVYSLESGSFPWAEGRMDLTFKGALVRYSGTINKGYFEFNLNTSNPTNFKETLISNVDYTNGTGSFVGYYETKQYFVSNGNNSKNYAFNQAGLTQVTGYTGGYFPISNQELTSAGEIYSIGFFTDGATDNYWVTNVLECEGKKASFRRESILPGKFTGGLILNSNSLTHKFNNNDEYRDWCNDTTTDGHSTAYRWDTLGVSGSATHIDIEPDPSNPNAAMRRTVVDATIITDKDISYSSVASALGTQCKPYLGFVSTANNWNKIYLKNFDNNLNTVLPNTDSNYSNNIITDSKGTHLKLGAGLPIVECKYEDKVTYEFEFNDTTKDYRVWVKEGSFDSSKNLSVDKNNCIKTFEVDGTTTYDSSNNCLVIKNGRGKATWEIENSTTVVYIKWAVDGTIDGGGGILLPAATVDIESA